MRIRTNPLIGMVTCDPAFRGGKPYIKEAGLTVRGILHMIASGWTVKETLNKSYATRAVI